MVFVHAFSSSLTTYYILKKNTRLKFSNKHLNIIWFLGILGGVFPDFDLALLYFTRDLEHRRLITHSILFYFSLFVCINVYIYFSKILKEKKNYILMSNLVFFIGVCTHLIIDYFVGGLVLLAPLTFHYFGYILPFDTKSNDWFSYFSSPYMIAESMIAFWYFEIRKNILNFVGKYLPLFFLFISVIVTFVLMFR